MDRFARYQLMGTGGALALALVALASAVGGPAWAAGAKGSAPAAAPNVSFGTETFHISNNSVRVATAKCPSGTHVFSGAWGIAGQHARVTAAGPSRKSNGYLVIAYMPPANLTAGITKETARIDIYAWCAPTGQPIVLGKP
jgi:hypothetical protein